MIKLIKYELRKQAFSKGIILAILGLLELLFLYGIIRDNNMAFSLSIALLVFVTYVAILYVAFENIFAFSGELNSKRSYMLFLIPRSSYEIVGAKVIAAGIQILITGFTFLLVAILDIGIITARYDMFARMKEMLVNFMAEITKTDINIKMILLVFLTLLLSWICTMTIGFFSITLSTTFLANKKLNRLISFVIFMGITILQSYIANKLFGIDISQSYNIYLSLYTICFIALTYLGTSWMLDKKVCV